MSRTFYAQPLSKLLVPLARGAKGTVSSVDLLNNHGFVRQVGSGIYDLLPLGVRVQNKIARIVRKHLHEAGCTELELSTLVNPNLWRSSGRLSAEIESDGKPSEFTFTEGKKHLLAPTGEEQITTLVGSVSYRQLPLSLYQITRKFRNELRPRGGLLRTREFLMKDLYTFDVTHEAAIESYARVGGAYHKIFTELGISFIRAEADSGDMGGDLSHEYHYVSESGEDKIVSCSSCGYAANIEKAISHIPSTSVEPITVDGANIAKGRMLSPSLLCQAKSKGKELVDWSIDPENGVPLVVPQEGDHCAHCDSELIFDSAIEVGHTFYLADRYTKPLKALVTPKQGPSVPISMGCYGIGLTRIIGAVAEKLKDEHGLKWPHSIAPFDCVVVSKNNDLAKATAGVLARNGIDAAYEDRTTQIGHAMRAARESGIPFTVVLGRNWDSDRCVDILSRTGTDPIVCSLEELPLKLKSLCT